MNNAGTHVMSTLISILLLSSCSMISLEERDEELPEVKIETISENCQIKPKIDELIIQCEWIIRQG